MRNRNSVFILKFRSAKCEELNIRLEFKCNEFNEFNNFSEVSEGAKVI